MSDVSVMFVKPNAINNDDKEALRKAEIIVIEIDNPQDAKFVRASAELSTTDMLLCATRTIRKCNSDATRAAFARAICEALETADYSGQK